MIPGSTEECVFSIKIYQVILFIFQKWINEYYELTRPLSIALQTEVTQIICCLQYSDHSIPQSSTV